MRKTFQIDGYAVNQRGHTVGIHYTLTSASPDTAKSSAQLLAHWLIEELAEREGRP